MLPDENKAICRRFAEEIFNAKHIERADELFVPDYVDHAPLPGQAPGLAGAKQKWALYIAAFPDMHVPIEDLVAEGDKVMVRWTLEAVHRGVFLGIPPTGKSIRMNGISICRLTEGKIVEQWELSDRLALMQQLGAIPMSGHAVR